MKTGLVLGVLALLPVVGQLPRPSTAATPAERAALQKTIVVSLQRIASESAEGHAAAQRLQALLQKMTLDLAAKQKDLAQPTGPEFQRLDSIPPTGISSPITLPFRTHAARPGL